MVFLRPECERVTQTEGQMEAICIARDWGSDRNGGHRRFLHPTKTTQGLPWIAVCRACLGEF